MFKKKWMLLALAIFLQATITYGEEKGFGLDIGKTIKGVLGGDEDAEKDKKDETKESTEKKDTQINIEQIDLNKFSELKKKAAAGDGDALYLVGLLLLEGNNKIDKNVKDALVYLNKAAEKNSDAQYTLGVLLFSGKNVKKDIDKGKDLLIQSAKSGNDKAVNYLIKQNIIKDKAELADNNKDDSSTEAKDVQDKETKDVQAKKDADDKDAQDKKDAEDKEAKVKVEQDEKEKQPVNDEARRKRLAEHPPLKLYKNITSGMSFEELKEHFPKLQSCSDFDPYLYTSYRRNIGSDSAYSKDPDSGNILEFVFDGSTKETESDLLGVRIFFPADVSPQDIVKGKEDLYGKFSDSKQKRFVYIVPTAYRYSIDTIVWNASGNGCSAVIENKDLKSIKLIKVTKEDKDYEDWKRDTNLVMSWRGLMFDDWDEVLKNSNLDKEQIDYFLLCAQRADGLAMLRNDKIYAFDTGILFLPQTSLYIGDIAREQICEQKMKDKSNKMKDLEQKQNKETKKKALDF